MHAFKSWRHLSRFFLTAVATAILLPTTFAQTPPFNQCPPVGLDSSCRILILIDANGGLRVLTDPNVSATYDGADDTLIGVLNLSDKTVAAIPLRGVGPIFGFDGDGICSQSIFPNPPNCPYGPTGYEGPSVGFSNISGDQTFGIVNFSPAVPANGGSTYFGLELAIQTQCSGINPPAALKQGDQRWAADHLGNSQFTIGDYGCFLTDLAMEINYYSQKQSSGFRTDPALLNTYLTANGAIDPNTGAVVEAKLPILTKYAGDNGVVFYYGGRITKRDDFTLDQYLCHGYPPVLGVGQPHWVLATGQAVHNGNQTYSDIDPDSYTDGNTLDNPDWNNTYSGMLLFTDLIGPLQGLYVTGHSPIELVITNQNGESTGYNPITKVRSDSILQSSYAVDQLANDTTHGDPLTPPIAQLSIVGAGATSGEYKLQVFGIGDGPYTIDITAYDTLGTGVTKSIAGTATKGVVSEVILQYSTIPGSDTSITTKCAADVNDDDVVNRADVAMVLAAFGARTGDPRYNPRADLNNNGQVGEADLKFVTKSRGCKTKVK